MSKFKFHVVNLQSGELVQVLAYNYQHLVDNLAWYFRGVTPGDLAITWTNLQEVRLTEWALRLNERGYDIRYHYGAA
jgi:hypothetical protein